MTAIERKRRERNAGVITDGGPLVNLKTVNVNSVGIKNKKQVWYENIP